MTGIMAPPDVAAVRNIEPFFVLLPNPRREMAKVKGNTPDFDSQYALKAIG